MSFATYLIFTLVNLALFIAANIYIPKRLCALLGIQKAKLQILGFVLLTVLGTAGIMAAARVTNPLLLNLFKITIIWLGVVFYLFFLLLVYEILKFFVVVDRKHAGIGIIVIALLVSIYGIRNARSYEVHEVDIPMDGLLHEVRIFHVPDIHLGPFRGKETLQKIVGDIERLKPDFVAVNGDLVDGMDGLDHEILGLFKSVSPDVVFTGGNHDEYVNLQRLEQILGENGVKVLNNEIIRRFGIQLVGLAYMNADDKVYDAHASSRTETIASVLPELQIDPDIPSIALHHSPVGIRYMNEAGIDLVLSGHTHAGQFFPATLIASFQFEYLKGLYEYKDTLVYVSQGIGTFGPPMRIGTEGEATLVRLIPRK